MSTTEASARCGNTGTLEAQNPLRETSGEKHDSISAPLYKIIDDPLRHLLPVETGESSSRIIEQATRVLRTVKASGMPYPFCVDFKADETTALCGKQFAIEKPLNIRFGSGLRTAMESTGVDYVSVLSVGDPHCPTITFGRNGSPEFIAYVVRGGE